MSIKATKTLSENVNSDKEVQSKVSEATSELGDDQLDAAAGGAENTGYVADGADAIGYLKYKLDRCFVKSWSTSGDAD